MSHTKDTKDPKQPPMTEHSEIEESMAANLAHQLKLKMKHTKKMALQPKPAHKNKASHSLEKPGLHPDETKDLALRLINKKKMGLTKELTKDLRLGKQGPSLTFAGVPVLSRAMELELIARQERKEKLEHELVKQLQQELQLQLENRLKNKEQPRKKKKIKPSWF